MRSKAILGALAGVVSLFGFACAGNFDTTRDPRPYADKSTLGQEVFGVLCDRIGAGVLNEDLSGNSFKNLCHPIADGSYANTVDQSRLPPCSGSAALTRNLAVAKIEAMARNRQDFIRAVDTVFPDVEIEDPHPDAKGPIPSKNGKIRLHDAVLILTQRLSPLYDSNPLAKDGAPNNPLLPSATQALARFFDTLSKSNPAQSATAQVGGRQGYRPLSIALGAIGPVLRYPNLRTLSKSSVRALGPGGNSREEFERALAVANKELSNAQIEAPPTPFVISSAETAQPNRPRDLLEILQSVLLSTDPAFTAANAGHAPIVARDPRGFALVSGSNFGTKGSVPSPFVDNDNNGLADVDQFGRFIDSTGSALSVDDPFDVPGTVRVRPADDLGRALLENGKPAYVYLDTSQTLVASLARNVQPLIDPDPAHDKETLFNAFAGAYVLFGDRIHNAVATYEDNSSLPFVGYDASKSPLVDFVHAAGQILGDQQSDDFLQQLIDLVKNHEQELARVVGIALELKRISDDYPDVGLPKKSTFWDEAADVIAKIAAVPPLNSTDPDGRTMLEDLILSFGDDRALGLGPAYAGFFKYKDKISYDPNDINGPVKNLSSNDLQAPHIVVDRSKPDTGENRSLFQRTAQLIFDSANVRACSKAGASVHLSAGVLGLSIPAIYPDDMKFDFLCAPYGGKKSPLAECEVYEIDDLGIFYLQAMLGRAKLKVKDPCLNGLGGAIGMDATFEKSSGLVGLTTKPSYQALSRLVWFGADTTKFQMPDLDPNRYTSNSTLNTFLSGLQYPLGTPLCPKNSLGSNNCNAVEDTIRVRDGATIFGWEHFGFREAMVPMLTAFSDYGREDLFAEMTSAIHRHMSSPQHGPECQKKGSFRDRNAPDYNPSYCSEDGLVKYEEMLTRQLLTDLIPAVHDLSRVLQAQKIKSSRYRKTKGIPTVDRRGSEVTASMIRALFDPSYAKTLGTADRTGNRSTTWNDGSPKAQLTPFDLFAKSLQNMDSRFESADGFPAQDLSDRKARWRKARSQLVDQFMAVDGSGTKARFKNTMTAKALLTGLQVAREQVNAQCPKRESDGKCEWAKKQLGVKTSDIMQGPLFAVIVDLFDKLRSDPNHAEIEKLALYLLTVVEDDETLRAVLASAVDIVQVLRDGQTLPPLFNVMASLSVPDGAIGPDGTSPAVGVADTTLQVLNVMSAEPDQAQDPMHDTEFDRYHVVETLIANLSKPIDPKSPSKTALEVFIDVATDVDRYDSSDTGPLAPSDIGEIARATRDFLTSPTRGMEQLYTVVRGRNGN